MDYKGQARMATTKDEASGFGGPTPIWRVVVNGAAESQPDGQMTWVGGGDSEGRGAHNAVVTGIRNYVCVKPKCCERR